MTSAVPYNTVWPGKQRPTDQTEISYFVSFDMSEAVELCIELDTDRIDSLAIRPIQYAVPFRADGDKVFLSIECPMNFTVEVNGYHSALHVFANPVSDDVPTENTIYFGSGEHHVGWIFPKSGQTVYIAEGATVYGSIYIYKQGNVRICGRGILDSSKFKRGDEYAPNHAVHAVLAELGLTEADTRRGVSSLCAYGCHGLKIEGIIFRDAPNWTLTTRNGCRDVEIDNIKLIGMWRYNSDGIDLCSTYNAVLKNSFIRSFDDCIVVRAPYLDGEECESGCENITVCNNVLWCDWGKSLEIWNGNRDSHIRNVTWKDNYLIHTAHYAVSIGTWFGSESVTVADLNNGGLYA